MYICLSINKYIIISMYDNVLELHSLQTSLFPPILNYATIMDIFKEMLPENTECVFVVLKIVESIYIDYITLTKIC